MLSLVAVWADERLTPGAAPRDLVVGRDRHRRDDRVGDLPDAGRNRGACPGSGVMLAVWLIGGLISLCGALSVAELAASLPQTGGWYVYLRESWGRLAGFLFGWSELVLIRASATGAIATVFSEYFLRSIGYDPAAYPAATDYIAAGAIVVAATTNIRGVRLGAAVAGASTVAKFGALAFLVVAAFVFGGDAGSTAHFT